MDKDKITRLKIILKHLKETKGLNQGQVASMIGLTSGAITKMLKNERAITIKTMLLFEHVHDISSEWFTSGQGDMILKKKGESRVDWFKSGIVSKNFKTKRDGKIVREFIESYG